MHRKLTYSIKRGNRGSAFIIDRDHGHITVNNKLDRELIDRYSLELVATVHGDTQYATCVAIITIEDANDNSPVFEFSSYKVSVKENVAKNMRLIQMIAHDKDEPNTDNSRIKYEIHSGQESEQWLRVDANTGWITTNKMLDREKLAQIPDSCQGC